MGWLGWVGVVGWLALGVWIVAAVGPDGPRPATGTPLPEPAVVVGVYETAAEPFLAVGAADRVFHPRIEYRSATGDGPYEDLSECFLREPPGVDSRVEVLTAGGRTPCVVGSLVPETYRADVSWPVWFGSAAAASVLVVVGAAGPARRLRVGLVAGTGAALIAGSWLLPWLTWHDENYWIVEVERAWQAFALFGHPFVVAGIGILVVRSLHPAGDPGSWLPAWVASVVLAGIGLAIYWFSAELFLAGSTDTDAWLGPGVPVATLGLVAILAAALARPRYSRLRRT